MQKQRTGHTDTGTALTPGTVLSVQSWVASGHVGNAAAVFPLQRLGHEVLTVNTVQFSNHTGYPHFRGMVHTAAEVAELIQGLDEHGALRGVSAVLSGYLGDPATARVIGDALRRVRERNSGAVYCCDPVIGDERGQYVHEDIPGILAEQLVPAADIVTPNHFELEHLLGRAVARQDVPAAAAELRTRLRPGGPQLVVVTSVPSGPGDQDTLLACADGVFLLRSERLTLPHYLSGTGDVLAALMLAHWLGSGDAPAALAKAVSGLHGVLEDSVALDTPELALIAAQEQLVTPRHLFSPVRLAA